MLDWMLLAQIEEPAMPVRITDLIMLWVNGIGLVLILLLLFRVMRRNRVIQGRALVQIERSLQHMDKSEQFMALQERQGDRIIELLELIDRNIRRSPS